MKKLEYIDVARGIAILLVVFGHALTKQISNSNTTMGYLRFFVYTIHMPVFFVISGFLFEANISKYTKYKKVMYLKDKLKKFIIPYLIFSILNYIIIYLALKINVISNVLSNKEYESINIKRVVLSTLTYIGHIDNHLWFLYVMFIILIINRVIMPILNKDKRTRVICILLSFAIYVISFNVSKWLPEIIWKVMRYNFIFLCGRVVYMDNIYKMFANNRKIMFIIGLISTVILLIIKDNKDKIYFPFINIIVELSMSYIIIFILSKGTAKYSLLKYIGNGEKTMVIYLLHMPFILPLIEYLLNKLVVNVTFSIIISGVLTIFIIDLIDRKLLEKFPIIKEIFFGIKSKKIENNN